MYIYLSPWDFCKLLFKVMYCIIPFWGNVRHVLDYNSMLFSTINVHFVQFLNCTKLALLTHFIDVHLEKKTQIGINWFFQLQGKVDPTSDHFYFLTVDGFRFGSNQLFCLIWDMY